MSEIKNDAKKRGKKRQTPTLSKADTLSLLDSALWYMTQAGLTVKLHADAEGAHITLPGVSVNADGLLALRITPEPAEG